eukprot:956252-Prymnesium_polylepis.1
MDMTSALEASQVLVDANSGDQMDESFGATAAQAALQRQQQAGAELAQQEADADEMDASAGVPGNLRNGAAARSGVVARLLALEPVANLFPQLAQRYGAVSVEYVSEEGGMSWIYIDDAGREQGPFSTLRMRKWLRKG